MTSSHGRSARAVVCALGTLVGASQAQATQLHIEENRGQAGPEAEFVARGDGPVALLMRGQAAFVRPAETVGERPTRVTMALVRARRGAGVGRDALPGRVHYLRGRSVGGAIRDVRIFAAVEYRDVYPGVDLTYRVSGGRLKYDFMIAPGADARGVRLRFDGARRVRLNETGDLVLETSAGELVHRAPVVYQDRGGARERVAGRFVLSGRTISFALGRYDRTRPLVIDPAVELASYLGGSADDDVAGVAVDGAGKLYVAGFTYSLDFPVAGSPVQGACRFQYPPCREGFVAKIDPAATGPAALIWATYLGGANDDGVSGIAVDTIGHAHVVGRTTSTDFPTTPGSFQPSCQLSSGNCSAGFVSKLALDGSAFVYSSFLSGPFNDDNKTAPFDEAQGVALDSAGNAYVVGSTAAKKFPVTAGAFQTTLGGARDAFLAKLDPQGAAIYVSYLGGSGTDDYVKVAVDSSGNAYVAGRTDSTNFPTRTPFKPAIGGIGDCFLAKFNASGSDLVYSTYIGGSGVDSCIGVGVDADGNASVTGQTFSPDLPLVAPIAEPNDWTQTYGDAFVMKLNAAGSALVFSTYLGGSAYDWGTGVAVDLEGNVYVTGDTNSYDFPALNPVRAFGQGGSFVTKFRRTGSIAFSTFISPNLMGGFGPGIAVGAAGRIVFGGHTWSTTLSTVDPFRPFGGGFTDGFVAIIDPSPDPPLAFYTLPPCRLVDTRRPNGPLGGPALQADQPRVFSLSSVCGVPPGARALAVNPVITGPDASGYLTLFPANMEVPLASTLNYSPAQTKSGNAIVKLSPTGRLAALAAHGSAHFVLDVYGYFAPPADLIIDIAGSAGNRSFAPSPVWVSSGQTVAWRNLDSMPHTATQDGGAFDTGIIAPGATSRPVTMTAAGLVGYHCSLHPSMMGSIEVR